MTHENLYESLGYNIPDDDLTCEEKLYLVETVGKLDLEQKELFYLLILHDYVKYNSSTKVVFPYKAKQISNDKIEIKVDAMPIRLKRILYKFVKLANDTAATATE